LTKNGLGFIFTNSSGPPAELSQRLESSSPEGLGTGTDFVNFNAFLPNYAIGVFLLKILQAVAKKCIIALASKKNANFFRRKLSKNCLTM
jgi:hypothetical protein